MERIVIRESKPDEKQEMLAWLGATHDGDLFDLDVLNHASTFSLCALGAESGRMAYLPVQQPLMLENLVFRPGLNDRERAQSITRLAEHVVSEGYRRDVGELYFLCRDESTKAFAARHCFKPLP